MPHCSSPKHWSQNILTLKVSCRKNKLSVGIPSDAASWNRWRGELCYVCCQEQENYTHLTSADVRWVSPCQYREVLRKFGGITPLTYNLVNGWSASRSGRFNSGKTLKYPFKRRLCGPRGQSAKFGDEKNLTPPSAFEPQFSGRPARTPGSVVTGLLRLS